MFLDGIEIIRYEDDTSSINETRKTKENWFTTCEVNFSKLKKKQLKWFRIIFRYANTGQLCCVLCNQQLTSETFWKAHVNGREHKQVRFILKKFNLFIFNIQKLLELKSNIKQSNTESVFAKPLPPPPLTTQQQQRGIKRPHDVGMSNKLNQCIIHKSTIVLF